MESEGLGPGAGEHPGEDRLLDLAFGFLPPAEESACLAHLRDCGECEGRARSLVSKHARFRSMAHGSEVLERLAARKGLPEPGFAAADQAKRPALPPWWFHFRWGWVIPMAAAAVFVVVLVRQAGRDSTAEFGPAWLVHPSSILVSNRDQAVPGFDPDLMAGLEAYERRDLDGAIRCLARAQVKDELESMRRAYLGSALAQRDRYREAVNVLRTLRDPEIPGILREETRWAFFVALSRVGEKASADSLLTLLSSEPGAVGDRARRRMNAR